MSWGEALLWGAVIVAVVLGALAAIYFLSKDSSATMRFGAPPLAGIV